MGIEFPTVLADEGRVKILVPKLEVFVEDQSEYAPSKAPVFFNPVMELNRDLAVLSLQVLQRSLKRKVIVCEPLSACGIRGIRLATEVEGVERVIINDINSQAQRLAKLNVSSNNLANRVEVANEGANLLLNRFAHPKKRFDFIDVDPFGSPMLYVDSALRAMRSGGLIALTATDLAPLCGVHPKACIRRYAGKPLRTEYCHELALRLVAGALARSAAKYDLGVKVVFSHSSKHYIRLYANTNYGAKMADASLKNIGYVSHCFSCFHREVHTLTQQDSRRTCPACKGKMNVAGPLWIGSIIDEGFVTSMQNEARMKVFRKKAKIDRLLTLVRNEANAPLTYYVVSAVCDKFNLRVPSINLIAANLLKAGYSATFTHFHTQGIRTNAPAVVFKETVAELASPL